MEGSNCNGAVFPLPALALATAGFLLGGKAGMEKMSNRIAEYKNPLFLLQIMQP